MTTWTRPCACGGEVRANPDDPTPGVREHNAGPEHHEWRLRREAVDRTRTYRARLRAQVELTRMQRAGSAPTAAVDVSSGASGRSLPVVA
jgi:hypothetical protein